MCGIVVYYGDAENNLSRVLSGMWAIVYRAPDSSGIGLIGSDQEPLKIRRELGSVDKLIDRLIDFPLFDEGELKIVSIMADDFKSYSDFVRRNQKKLLDFESFSFETQNSDNKDKNSYLRWSALTDTQNVQMVEPGAPGNPEIQEYLKINSKQRFIETIDLMVTEFDLSLAVIEKLMQRGLEAALDNKFKLDPPPVERADLLNEFKQIFERFAYDGDSVQPQRTSYQKTAQKNPFVRKYLWQCLKDVIITLPSDHTTDGIANLFRSIDSAVLAHRIQNPQIDDSIQMIFENLWKANNETEPVHWLSLYRTERLYNVYGIAAASAFAWFQTEVFMKNMLKTKKEKDVPPGHIPGRTHPLVLKYMVQPIIAQGRWAVQSSVSVKNSHPFVDTKKQRAVVLNGVFNSDTESRIKKYITDVAGINLRSTNSTELFVMLWEYYFDTASGANNRYKVIEKQHQLGLEDISICSQSIDYGIYKTLGNKTEHDIDEISFIKAMEVMITGHGQFAVSGISMVSPNRLFIATHQRPLYIVKRQHTMDFMVVSDINAALGLFSNTLIRSTSIKLRKLMKEYSKKSVVVETRFFDDDSDNSEAWFKRKKMELLAPFEVDIYALDQKRIFARIQTKAGTDTVLRKLEIMDFQGKAKNDILPEKTYLTPISLTKDFGKTFYEEHLFEIPGLINDILNRYTCSKNNLPEFDIRKRLLLRRFGKNLSSLKRIIIVGTGSEYLAAQIVEKNLEHFFSSLNIIAVRPGEINNINSFINPDRDLILMVSWSGTSSDMINFAGALLSKNILMVGITEKPFSDMALIVRESIGVIPTFCGEEVTIVPLKTAVGILLVLYLFSLYISSLRSVPSDEISHIVEEMHDLSEKINTVLNDKKVNAFCTNCATSMQNTSIHYIIDAYHDVGVAKLAAENLELNSWTSMGKAVDFSEINAFTTSPPANHNLILVNATNKQRISQSLDFMKALNKINKPFFAVSYKNREEKTIKKYAYDSVILPKVSDYLQPFIDLPFMFLLGFYFGLARGRLAGEMPRNVVKSVTAGREINNKHYSNTDILTDLKDKNQILTKIPNNLLSKKDTPCWIDLANNKQEEQYYIDLLKLAYVFYENDPFAALFSTGSDSKLEVLSTFIFKHLAEDGVIIFVPMDKQAEAGCQNFIHMWDSFFNCPLQIEFPEKIKNAETDDNLIIAVASEELEKDALSGISWQRNLTILENLTNLIWIGPGNKNYEKIYYNSEAYLFKTPKLSCKNEHVYFALSVFFSKVIGYKFPERTNILNNHFKLLLPTINALLNNKDFRRNIKTAMQENQSYKKGLFITSFTGNTISWEKKFKPHKTKGIASETFGASTYSHLVLIDPKVDTKYVKLESRSIMKQLYSDSKINAWEKLYLGGASVDDFLVGSSMPFKPDTVLPFMVDEKWYFPVLKPGYDTDQDCLVILDATSEKYFDSALDELATFGSRYARLIVITQECFVHDARLSNLKKYPLSNIILIPPIVDLDTNPCILSDFILPVVINIIGSALKFLDRHYD